MRPLGKVASSIPPRERVAESNAWCASAAQTMCGSVTNDQSFMGVDASEAAATGTERASPDTHFMHAGRLSSRKMVRRHAIHAGLLGPWPESCSGPLVVRAILPSKLEDGAMSVQMECVGKTFDQVFENFQTAMESTLQVQKDLLRKWTALWPGIPKIPPEGVERFQQFQKEWPRAMAELTRKYVEVWERQCKAGLETLEEAFQLPGAKDPEELRQKLTQMWRKSFESLKELAEAQVRNFQVTVERFVEPM